MGGSILDLLDRAEDHERGGTAHRRDGQADHAAALEDADLD
jgi:hypothetical protein